MREPSSQLSFLPECTSPSSSPLAALVATLHVHAPYPQTDRMLHSARCSSVPLRQPGGKVKNVAFERVETWVWILLSRDTRQVASTFSVSVWFTAKLCLSSFAQAAIAKELRLDDLNNRDWFSHSLDPGWVVFLGLSPCFTDGGLLVLLHVVVLCSCSAPCLSFFS